MKNERKMSKRSKRGLWKAALISTLAVCLGVGGGLLGADFATRAGDTNIWEIENNNNAAAGNLASTGGYELIDKRVDLEAGSMKTTWTSVTTDTSLTGKTIIFTMKDDWNLDSGSDALNSPLTPPAGYDIILDLNGHSIYRTLSSAIATGNVITVPSGANFTLDDTAGGGGIYGGKVTGGTMAAGGGAGGISNRGTFIFNGGKIYNNSGSFAGGIESIGTFTMNGGTVTGNQTTSCGSGTGLCIYYGTTTINGGEIYGNTCTVALSSQIQAQVYLWGDAGNASCSYTMNGGKISSGSNSFGVVLCAGTTFDMYGGEITGCNYSPVSMYLTNNSTCSNPYGTYTNNKRNTFNLYGGSLHDNNTSANDGTNQSQAVRIANNTFNMYGGSIYNNNTGATSTIFSAGDSSGRAAINIHGGSIDHNNCTNDSGAIFVMNTDFLIDGGDITENTSNGYIIFLNHVSGSGSKAMSEKLKLYGGRIVNNKSAREAIGCWTLCEDIEVKGAPVVSGNQNGDLLVLMNTYSYIKIVGRLEDADGNRAHIGTKVAFTIPNYTGNGSSANVNGYDIPTSSGVYPITTGYASYYSSSLTPPDGGAKTAEYNFLPASTYFFANDNGSSNDYYYVSNKTYTGSGTTVSHEALITTNTGREVPFIWEYEENGSWHTINNEVLEFTYGEHNITNVRATRKGFGNGDGTGNINYDIFSTEYTTETVLSTSSEPGVNGEEYHGPFQYYASTANSSFSGIKDAGFYTFGIYDGYCNAKVYSWSPDMSISIIVKPKDLTVTLKSGEKLYYGYSATELDTRLSSTNPSEMMYNITGLVGSDTAAGLGIKISHIYGTEIGTQGMVATVTKASAKNEVWVSNSSNPNYNVNFTDRFGYFTIDPRPITVLLNDDYSTYGDTAKKVQETTVTDAAVNGTTSILTKTKNDSTPYNDEKGTAVTSSGTGSETNVASGGAYYKGGWYYDTSSKEFINFDLTTTGRFPFSYKFNYTAGTDVYSGDTDKWLNAKDYFVTVTSENPNYTVTFKNAQDNTRTNSFKYTVRKADVTIDESKAPQQNGKAAFREREYDSTAKTVEFPWQAAIRKGAFTSPVPATQPTNPSITVNYWAQAFTETEYTDSGFTAPTLAGTSWQATSPAITNAGKYKIYVKIDIDNHNEKLYDFIYEVKAYELEYDIVLERLEQPTDPSPTALVKGQSGYSVAYNGAPVVAKIVIRTSSEPSFYASDNTKPTFTFYYKGDSTTDYGKTNPNKFPDDSGNDENSNPRNLGNSNAPAGGGGYTATFIDQATVKNYVLKTGGSFPKSVSFTITKKKIDAPSVPSTASKIYYTAQVQDVPLTAYGFDPDLMEFVEDQANGLYLDTTGTDKPDGTTKKIVFNPTSKLVRVLNAGTYKLQFKVKDSDSLVWDGDAATTRELAITVLGAPIYIEWANTIAEATATDKWKWEVGSTGDITYTVKFTNNGGAAYETVAGTPDDVKVKLNWKKATDADTAMSPFASVVAGSTGTYSVTATDPYFGTAGKYVLICTVDTSDTISKNYAFDDNKTNADRQEFTADSASVNTSSFVWEYVSDKTGATKANWTSASEIKFEYKYPDKTNTDESGLTYTFNLKMGTNGLDGYSYIKLDSSKYTNGYQIEKWNDNTSDWVVTTDGIQDVGKYRITAALVIDASDTEHKFVTKVNGVDTESKNGDATLEIEVKKGEFDLSGVKWGYIKDGKEVEYTGAFGYNGGAQSIQLINLPKGLTINPNGYKNNKKTAVDNTYKAEVTASGIVVDTTKFEKPSLTDNVSVFTKDWEIAKGKITADWDTKEAGSDHIYYLPIYKDSSVTCVEVKYYEKDAYDLDPVNAPEIAAGDIINNPDDPVSYIAVMSIKASEDGNYVLVNETGAEIDPDPLTTTDTAHKYEFTPGDGKVPVKLSVAHKDGKDSYNGEHHLEIEIDCKDATMKDISKFTVEIYKCVDESNLTNNIKPENYICKWTPDNPNDPVEAGKYVIAIGFTQDVSSDFALMSNKFLFEIKKADLSGLLGGMQWGFIEEGVDDNGNPTKTEVPYDSSSETEYTLKKNDDGTVTPVERKPVIIGLPNTEEKLQALKDEGLVDEDLTLDEAIAILKLWGILDGSGESAITPDDSKTERGKYTSTFTLPTLDEDNFEPIEAMAPAGLVDTNGDPVPLNWEIVHKQQTKPESKSVTYSGAPQSLMELAGLDPADKGVYYDITGVQVLNGMTGEYEDVPADFDITKVDGTGTYKFNVKLLDTVNSKWAGASGGTTPAAVTVTVKKQELNVTGWDTSGDIPKPIIVDQDGNPVDDYEKYFDLEIYDETGKLLGKGADNDVFNDPDYNNSELTLKLAVKNTDYVDTASGSKLETTHTVKLDGYEPISHPTPTLSTNKGSLDVVYDKGGIELVFSGGDSTFAAQLKAGIITVLANGEALSLTEDGKIMLTDADDYEIVLSYSGNNVWANEKKTVSLGTVSIATMTLDAPTLKNFEFTGLTYGTAASLGDLLTGFDPDVMTLTTDKTVRNAGNYVVTIAIKDEYKKNYSFSAATVLPLAAALAEGDEYAAMTEIDAATLEYALTVSKAKLSSPTTGENIVYGEDGTPMYVLPQEYVDNGAQVEFGRTVYDSATSTSALAPDTAIEKNVDYWYVFTIGGTDARNFEFEDGTVDKNDIASSTRDYKFAIPLSGAAAFFSNVMGFLKSWWWILLIALLVLLIIIIIIVAVKKKKKKAILLEEQRKREFEEEKARQEQLEAQRRADEEAREERRREEERKREQERKEEQRMEREERMMEMRNRQMMQQQMPQMPPQIIQQPAPVQQQMPQQMPMMPQMMPMMPQMMPQMSGGGGGSSARKSEALRIAEERARAAEDRAKIAEEKVARLAEDAQSKANQPAPPAYPQPPVMPMNGMYQQMPMMPPMMPMPAPVQQPAPAKDTTVKITENAANMLGEAIASSLSNMIMGKNSAPAPQPAAPASAPAQQQPAMSVQINMPPNGSSAQGVPAVSAQSSVAAMTAPQIGEPAGGEQPRRRLRL